MKMTEELYDKVKEALDRYEEATSADADERALAIDDMVFAFSEDGQWDGIGKERRRNKPRYTINQIAAAINETVGNYRQNRIEIKARPAQDASKEEAQTYNGMIRAIISNSDAEIAKDVCFKSITTSGMGGVKVLNQYTDDNPFEQDVAIIPSYDALHTYWFDPMAKHPTAKDGRYCFEESTMSRSEFKSTYPDAELSTFPEAQYSKLQSSWGCDTGDTVRIADYYVKEPVTLTKVLLSDGSIILGDDYKDVKDELEEKGIEFVDAKDVETFKVMCYRMSGSEILEEPKEIPSRFLPLIRCLGYYEWSDSVLHYRGIVRASKDPQRVYNYATSANIEATALKPKDKVLGTNKMFLNHEQKWADLNNSNSNILTYTPDPQAPEQRPVPFAGSQATPELIQQAQQAQMDLQSTIGRRAPAQQESAQDRSGRAILALQRQDDSVTFELLDNLAQTWEQVATVVMDMVPSVYDQERQVAILNDDGEEEIITINEAIRDEETGKDVKINDTSKRYRIKASVGPAFETKRTEAVNVLSTLGQNPQFGALIPDLLAKSLDFPFSDELTKRFRKMLIAQGAVDMTEEEKEEQAKMMQTPEGQAQAKAQQEQMQLQMMATQLQLQRAQLENANLEANISNLRAATAEKIGSAAKDTADVQETYVDVYAKQVDSLIKSLESGIVPSQEQVNAISQSLQLLDATQRDEYQRRINQALQQAQQLRQGV